MDVRSPAVGKVLRLSIAPGTRVERGQEIMMIESMKVEIPIKAVVAGTLREFRVGEGDQIQRNMVLAVIDG